MMNRETSGRGNPEKALRSRIVGEEDVAPDQLLANPANWRRHPKEQHAALEGMLRAVGWVQRVIVNRRTGHVVDGHLRVEVALRRGEPTIPVLYVDLSDQEERVVLAAIDPIGGLAETDQDMLDGLLDGVYTGDSDLDAFLEELRSHDDEAADDTEVASLADEFGCPPFSVIDTRQGFWQARKKAWNVRIGDNGESREGTLFSSAKTANEFAQKLKKVGTVSILDAALAETLCRWFGRPGFTAIDPFAGDSVFGFVACSLGLSFKGIELRKEQAELNQGRLDAAGLSGVYINDTSENIDAHIDDESADMVFSCPPYADLEVYSDDPRDLSNMPTAQFMELYGSILGSTYRKLKDNRFAVIVISEVRAKGGEYIGLVPHTIDQMCAAGYKFWNEIILINSHGTLPLRAGGPMRASRKVGRTHQNVLVFCKGDPTDIEKDGTVEPIHDKALIFFKGNPGAIREEMGEIELPVDLIFTDPGAGDEDGQPDERDDDE